MKHLLTQWQMAVKWSIALFASLCCLLFWGCKQATHFQMQLEHMNELESIIYVEGQAKILLLPIQESADESLLQIQPQAYLVDLHSNPHFQSHPGFDL